MRVLFVTHSYPRWNGDAAGSFLLRLASALADEGVDVAVAAPSGPDLPAHEVLGGIPVHRFRYAPRSWETLAYTGNMATDALGSWKGRLALLGYLGAGVRASIQLQRTFTPDLIHAHWWFPAGLQVLATSALSGRPFVVTMHGSDVRFANAVSMSQPFFRSVLGSACGVTSVSSWLAALAFRLAPQARPRVLPMPAATELFYHDPQAPARDPARILFVGRLNHQKGILRLIDAVGALATPASLDVVGDGPDAATARDRAAALGIAERVRWLGALPQPALPPLYRRASVLAVPSIGEGLGLTAVEAQLCGTPVVAFDSGGISDAVAAGQTGLLVPEGDVTAFAQALSHLLADPAYASALGDAGAQWALQSFSPQAVAKRYAAFYRDAAAA